METILTFDELAELLAAHREDGESFAECYEALSQNLLRQVGARQVGDRLGQWSAHTAWTTFCIREWTTREAGIPTLGFVETLEKLAACPPDRQLLQWNLAAPDRVFVLFIIESSREMLGCIRVMRRLGNGLEVDRSYRQQCPCCGYYTLSRRGRYDICPVCFWEDDAAAEIFGQSVPERPNGVNLVQIGQARENFLSFGAAEERRKKYVRSPYRAELPQIHDLLNPDPSS